MKTELLSPGMEHADKPRFGPQVFGVGGKGLKGLGRGLEEERKKRTTIAEDEAVKLMREGEDDVKIGYGKQFPLPVFDPLLFLKGSALWAMPVSATVVLILFRAAIRPGALIKMVTQRSGSAPAQLLHHAVHIGVGRCMRIMPDELLQGWFAGGAAAHSVSVCCPAAPRIIWSYGLGILAMRVVLR